MGSENSNNFVDKLIPTFLHKGPHSIMESIHVKNISFSTGASAGLKLISLSELPVHKHGSETELGRNLLC